MAASHTHIVVVAPPTPTPPAADEAQAEEKPRGKRGATDTKPEEAS